MQLTLEEIQDIILELEAEGKVRDSGKRRNGRIVWTAVPEDEFTGKPWPRYIRDDKRVV
jgi:hypothetical protein